MKSLIRELCQIELKQIQECMDSKCSTETILQMQKDCFTRLHMYKTIDDELSGGYAYWEEYAMQKGKTIFDSTEEELLLYIAENPLTSSDKNFFGAVNKLSQFYIEIKGKSAAAARELAYSNFGVSEQIRRQQQQQRESVSNLFVDLTQEPMSNVASNAIIPYIDMTKEDMNKQLINVMNDLREQPISREKVAAAVGIVLAVFYGPYPELKVILLVIIFSLYKYMQMKKLN